MMSSLRAWCNTPVRHIKSGGYKPNSEPDMTGMITLRGYVTGELVNIIDNDGHETLSSAQIYLPDNPVINTSDKFMLADNEVYNIKKIRDFYDGNTGLVDIRVVYL